MKRGVPPTPRKLRTECTFRGYLAARSKDPGLRRVLGRYTMENLYLKN